MKRLPIRSCIALCGLLACVLTWPTPAPAQPVESNGPGPDDMLGMTEKELLLWYPQSKQLKKHIAGPGGSQGRWTIADVLLGGQVYDGTVYLSASKVSRVEYINAADQTSCRNGSAFERAKAFLTQRFGESQATGTIESRGIASVSLAFSDESTDASLYRSETVTACVTRIVYKPHQEKDAETL